jgi:hypothetical protein
MRAGAGAVGSAQALEGRYIMLNAGGGGGAAGEAGAKPPCLAGLEPTHVPPASCLIQRKPQQTQHHSLNGKKLNEKTGRAYAPKQSGFHLGEVVVVGVGGWGATGSCARRGGASVSRYCASTRVAFRMPPSPSQRLARTRLQTDVAVR